MAVSYYINGLRYVCIKMRRGEEEEGGGGKKRRREREGTAQHSTHIHARKQQNNPRVGGEAKNGNNKRVNVIKAE
jgi:hypothetical protein